MALAIAGSPTVRAQNSCYTDEVLVANQDVLGLSVATNGIVYYADYFGGTFGFLDLATDTLSTLVSGLKGKGFEPLDPAAEDWGWVVPIKNDGFNLWIELLKLCVRRKRPFSIRSTSALTISRRSSESSGAAAQ